MKAFYRLLDGGDPNLGQVTNKRHVNKENTASRHHSDAFGDLQDPFEGNPTQRNPYSSGSTNPYSQRKQPASNSTNPYHQYQQNQRQGNVQTNGRFSPMPRSSPKPPPTVSSASPTLTQDQKRRMEENRKRALAIRMKKQNSSSH